MGVPKPFLKVGVGCLVVVLVCLGGIGFMAWRILGGTVKPTTDYAAEINAIVATYQKDAAGEPDAWNELQELLSHSQNVHEAMRPLSFPGESANAIPDPDVLRSEKQNDTKSDLKKLNQISAAVRLMVNLRSEGVFSQLDALASRQHIVRTSGSGGKMLIAVGLPELSPVRQLARANAARYHLAVIDGKDDEAVLAFESGLALGRFFAQQGSLIDRSIGISLILIHITTMLETVDQHWDPETLRKLMEILERQTTVPPITLTFEVERRMLLDTIQWTFTDLGNGNGYLSEQGASMFFGKPGNQIPGRSTLLGAITADRKDTTSALNWYFDLMAKYATMPRPERMKGSFQPDVELENLSRRYMVLKKLLPGQWSIVNNDDEFKMRVAAAKIVLGIKIWQRSHEGQLPQNLTMLAPEVMNEVPMDPFTRQSFGYKLGQEERDGSAGTYVLYSLGADGVDDGGVEVAEPPDGSGHRYDVLMRSPPPRGFDFVVYPVRSYDH